jgi:hypothetical protein
MACAELLTLKKKKTLLCGSNPNQPNIYLKKKKKKKALNETWKSHLEENRKQVLQWKESQELLMNNTIADEKRKFKEVSDSRISALEEKFNHRVSECVCGVCVCVSVCVIYYLIV